MRRKWNAWYRCTLVAVPMAEGPQGGNVAACSQTWSAKVCIIPRILNACDWSGAHFRRELLHFGGMNTATVKRIEDAYWRKGER